MAIGVFILGIFTGLGRAPVLTAFGITATVLCSSSVVICSRDDKRERAALYAELIGACIIGIVAKDIIASLKDLKKIAHPFSSIKSLICLLQIKVGIDFLFLSKMFFVFAQAKRDNQQWTREAQARLYELVTYLGTFGVNIERKDLNEIFNDDDKNAREDFFDGISQRIATLANISNKRLWITDSPCYDFVSAVDSVSLLTTQLPLLEKGEIESFLSANPTSNFSDHLLQSLLSHKEGPEILKQIIEQVNNALPTLQDTLFNEHRRKRFLERLGQLETSSSVPDTEELKKLCDEYQAWNKALRTIQLGLAQLGNLKVLKEYLERNNQLDLANKVEQLYQSAEVKHSIQQKLKAVLIELGDRLSDDGIHSRLKQKPLTIKERLKALYVASKELTKDNDLSVFKFLQSHFKESDWTRIDQKLGIQNPNQREEALKAVRLTTVADLLKCLNISSAILEKNDLLERLNDYLEFNASASTALGGFLQSEHYVEMARWLDVDLKSQAPVLDEALQKLGLTSGYNLIKAGILKEMAEQPELTKTLAGAEAALAVRSRLRLYISNHKSFSGPGGNRWQKLDFRIGAKWDWITSTRLALLVQKADYKIWWCVYIIMKTKLVAQTLLISLPSAFLGLSLGIVEKLLQTFSQKAAAANNLLIEKGKQSRYQSVRTFSEKVEALEKRVLGEQSEREKALQKEFDLRKVGVRAPWLLTRLVNYTVRLLTLDLRHFRNKPNAPWGALADDFARSPYASASVYPQEFSRFSKLWLEEFTMSWRNVALGRINALLQGRALAHYAWENPPQLSHLKGRFQAWTHWRRRA